jgi:hypothetical protein
MALTNCHHSILLGEARVLPAIPILTRSLMHHNSQYHTWAILRWVDPSHSHLDRLMSTLQTTVAPWACISQRLAPKCHMAILPMILLWVGSHTSSSPHLRSCNPNRVMFRKCIRLACQVLSTRVHSSRSKDMHKLSTMFRCRRL